MEHTNFIVFSRILEEIKTLITDGDLNLGSRLLLDAITESDLGKNILQKGIYLRATYNKISSEEKIDKKEFENVHQEFINFLNELDNILEESEKVALSSPQRPTENVLIPTLKTEEEVIFRAKDLHKKYKSMAFELKNIDLDLKFGELTGIVGENGNGKTTLLRIIAGDLSHSRGTIGFPPLEYPVKNWYSIKQQIAFIPQRLPKWKGLLKDNLHFSASNHGIFGKENEEMVDFIIHRLGLTKYKNAKWNDISSGFKLRFELARAMVWRPKLLVLDEPLANLDINAKLLFMQDLKLLAKSKKYPLSVILSSQQLHELESVVDNMLFLKNGNPIFSGNIDLLGKGRETNTFEMSGDFDRQKLAEIFQNETGISIEDTGQSLILTTKESLNSSEVLAKIIAQKSITYFRDISKSTRQFF